MLAAALGWAGMALAQPGPALPSAQAAGQARLTVFGFSVYDARLWVAPGFRRSTFADHALALELTYLRDFTGADIAKRSLQEMRRAEPIDAGQAALWQDALGRLLPDVKAGDKLLGVHHPRRGASFTHNGKPVGEIADPRFSRLFFGIWLGITTSEPSLREALLEGTPP
jgi:hypothetical protein